MTDDDRTDLDTPPSPAPLPPLHKRVLAVFFSPGTLFEQLARDPRWVGALLLGAVLVVISVVSGPTELYEATIREQLMRADQPVPDDLSTMAGISRWAGGAGALIFGPLMTAALAGIVTLIFAIGMGDDGRYRQYLAGTAHAFLVASVAAVALLPLKISTGDLQLRLSVGTFMPFLEEGWIASALSWLDLFALWAWVLVGLSASKIDPRRSWGSATVVILSTVVVITFGVAAIFGR